jgi:hypothetical protein
MAFCTSRYGYGMNAFVGSSENFWLILCSLIAVKVMLGVQLITYALRRQRGMRSREVEEVANDGKKPIGQSLEEKVKRDVSIVITC